MVRDHGLRRSLSDFKRHPWLHAISVSTVTAALLILGCFFICYRNFEMVAEKTNSGTTGTVYLKDGLTVPQIEGLKERVRALDKVAKVEFKPRAAVVEDLQVFLGGANTETLPGSELFPDVLELELQKDASLASLGVVKAAVAKFTEVSEVDFSEDWLVQYRKVRQFMKIFGGALTFGILFGCSFIIANFMGMRHQARKDEIELKRLIGANRAFILAPFLWEGLIEGLLGAALALAFLYVIKVALSTLLSAQWTAILGLRDWLFLSPAQSVGLVALGVAMAFIGSVAVFLRLQEKAAV